LTAANLFPNNYNGANVPAVLLPADISYLQFSPTAVLHSSHVTACHHERRGVLSRPRTTKNYSEDVLEASLIFKKIHPRAHGDFGQKNFIKIITYHNYHNKYYNKMILEEIDKKENREIAEIVIKILKY
jgi:hypothetical protein